jgi:hypothetical protein
MELTMDYTEYKKRLDNLSTSDAPIYVKTAAIEALKEKYRKNTHEEVYKQIAESSADISDIGDME